MALSDLLINRVLLQRVGYARDSEGGQTETATTIAVNVPCSVQPAKSSTKLDHARRGNEVTKSVYFDHEPDLRVNDRIVSGALVFVVAGKAIDEAGRGEVWRVDCKERA